MGDGDDFDGLNHWNRGYLCRRCYRRCRGYLGLDYWTTGNLLLLSSLSEGSLVNDEDISGRPEGGVPGRDEGISGRRIGDVDGVSPGSNYSSVPPGADPADNGTEKMYFLTCLLTPTSFSLS